MVQSVEARTRMVGVGDVPSATMQYTHTYIMHTYAHKWYIV